MTDVLADYDPRDAEAIRDLADADAHLYGDIILPSDRVLTPDEGNRLIRLVKEGC